MFSNVASFIRTGRLNAHRRGLVVGMLIGLPACADDESRATPVEPVLVGTVARQTVGTDGRAYLVVGGISATELLVLMSPAPVLRFADGSAAAPSDLVLGRRVTVYSKRETPLGENPLRIRADSVKLDRS